MEHQKLPEKKETKENLKDETVPFDFDNRYDLFSTSKPTKRSFFRGQSSTTTP